MSFNDDISMKEFIKKKMRFEKHNQHKDFLALDSFKKKENNLLLINNSNQKKWL